MTGLSQVNFDVEGLGGDEDEELDKEDAERERELHELLINELPEDLLEDNNVSFTSPAHSSMNQSLENMNEVENVRDHLGSQGAGPPQMNRINMLLTKRGEDFIQRFGTSTTSDEEYHQMLLDDNDVKILPTDYRDSEYGYTEDDGEYRDDHHMQYAYHDGDNISVGSGDSYHNDGDEDIVDDGGNVVDGEEYCEGTYDVNIDTQSYNPLYHNELQDSTSPDINMIEDFKVQYKRGGTLDMISTQHKNFQQQSMLDEVTGSSSTVEMAQLKILHDARKRKLEELAKEMASKEKDYERQIRVLKHQLALAKGERDGMASSLKHAQEIATNRQNELDEIQRKLENADIEKEQLVNNKDEIACQLESAKKTIENLHQQVMQLERSESLSRAREQHENIIAATKKRHEEDVTRLKQKLDDVSNTLMWKEEESKRLQDELGQARKEADRVRLDRAETVNRLTRSLEESQKQNEKLLNSGSSQELSNLQRQLSYTQTEKENLAVHLKTMEADVVELKEQLRMFETMSKIDRTSREDDDIKRNLAADDWRTPGTKSGQQQSKLSMEEALVSLQNELQHSLSSNRTKRDEIQDLRSKFENVQKMLKSKENEVERLELLVKKQEIRVLEQEKKISELEEFNKTPEFNHLSINEDIVKYQCLIKDQAAKLDEYMKREQELELLNQRLKAQMSEMVRDHDVDIKKSVEECRESCIEFHDQALATMKQQLTEEHETELKKLGQEIELTMKQLNEVKESYVALSEESRWIEKQTRESCEEDMKQKIKEIETKLEENKVCELLELREKLSEEIERSLEKERMTWLQEEEERFKEKVDAELAIAKMDWIKDEQTRRDKTVENALVIAEKKWNEKHVTGEGREKKWEEKIKSLKDEWNKEKDREIVENLKKLRFELAQHRDESLRMSRKDWELSETVETGNELNKARQNWELELAFTVKQAQERAVEKAKVDWLNERDGRAKEEMSKEMIEAAKKEWEREKDIEIKKKLETEKKTWKEEHKETVKQAVLEAEETWNKEHLNKVNDAVKAALEVAEKAWCKEKESAIESAVSRSLHLAKETWTANKIKEIEQILSNSRKQWINELSSSKQDQGTSPCSRVSMGSSEQDINETFSYLEARYSKNLKEFRENELARVKEEYEGKLRSAVLEHEMKLKELETRYEEKLDNLTKSSGEKRDVELKDIEIEYQNKLTNIVEEIEEKWQEKKTALEKDWTEKLDKQRDELRDSYRDKYQKERENMGRQMREKYDKAIEHVRKKYEHQFKEKLQSALERAKNEWEVEQEEDRIAVEEQHLKEIENVQEKLRKSLQKQHQQTLDEARDEHTKKIRELEEARDEHMKKIRELEEEIRTQRNEHGNCKMVNHDIGTQTDTPGNNSWISLSELPDDTSNCKQLNNLRQQYLTITAQMKDDLMKHALETRNNAARAIRSEVAKERHSTAKQLRKHYLECLKQILEEDKQSYQNDRPTKTNDEKMNMMAERLCLPGEKNETKCSHESTLTNVTTLNETASKDHELHNSSDNKRFFSKTSRYLQPNDVTSNVSSRRSKRNKAKKGGENDVKEVGKNPRDSGKHKLQSSVVQDVGISYFESNSLSFESLDIDLPPVTDLEVQSSSDDIKNDAMARIDCLERHVTDKNAHDTENVRQKTQFGERNTFSTDRETHSMRHDNNPTSPETRKIFINEEDEGFNATTSDEKTQLPIRSTNSLQKTKEIQTHEQNTRSNEKRKQKYISWQETQNNRDVTQVKAGRPVTYETSSKVVPSTQSTAASHASRVFSYTMHSNKNR